MERGEGGQEREGRERGREEDLTQDPSPLTLQEWAEPGRRCPRCWDRRGGRGVGVGAAYRDLNLRPTSSLLGLVAPSAPQPC